MARYYEDVTVGTEQTLGSWRVTKDEIVDFASRFDPQPIHVDEEAAQESIFGELVASGIHTLSICMRIAVKEYYLQSENLAGERIDRLRWEQPVYPGETLTVRSTVVEKSPSDTHPNRGTIVSRIEMFNQADERVLHLTVTAMFKRRSPGDV